MIDDIADTLQRFVRQAGDILQVGVAGRTAADQGKKIQGSLFRVQLASFMRIGNLIALLFRLCKNRRPRFFADRRMAPQSPRDRCLRKIQGLCNIFQFNLHETCSFSDAALIFCLLIIIEKLKIAIVLHKFSAIFIKKISENKKQSGEYTSRIHLQNIGAFKTSVRKTVGFSPALSGLDPTDIGNLKHLNRRSGLSGYRQRHSPYPPPKRS